MNEEEIEWRTEGETQFEDVGGDFDLEQVRQGREEEMNKGRGMKRLREQARLRPRRNGSIR